MSTLIIITTCIKATKTRVVVKLYTHSTTRLDRLAKALSGMWRMRLSASVSACRFPWCCRGTTGTSVRLLSSSHRCLSCCKPWKLSSGTTVMWFASRRLDRDRVESNRLLVSSHLYTYRYSITKYLGWKWDVSDLHSNFNFLQKNISNASIYYRTYNFTLPPHQP